MAKITDRIEGYADMTAEEKLKALEDLELEDNAAELERYKKAVSKASSEAAEWKRKHNSLLSEEEQRKQEQADSLAQMQTELEQLRKEKLVSEYTAKFIGQGYEEALAKESANYLSEGNMEKVFANNQKFLESFAQKLKGELLKDTPRPPAGDGTAANKMTLKKLKTLSDAEYAAFAAEHPEEYKALYEKGD